MLSTSTKDKPKEEKDVLIKNMTAAAIKRRIGIENHQTFWMRLDAMTDEEWTDENGTMCRPIPISKNYSYFMPNQIYCIYKKFGIHIPRIN